MKQQVETISPHLTLQHFKEAFPNIYISQTNSQELTPSLHHLRNCYAK